MQHQARTARTTRRRGRSGTYPRAENAASSALERALAAARAAAREGHQLASDGLTRMGGAVAEAKGALRAHLDDISSRRARTQDATASIRGQLGEVIGELEALHRDACADLEARRLRLDHFSVALFGRTMAGKSTVMEILTRGDGASIGRGAQRTTRDVRTYEWNGLRVTDVPGVAAFEGQVDEDVAYEAASKADVILFLITDDAPQDAEAEALARIRRLGKPVFGICNVKKAITGPKQRKLFLRRPERSFDEPRLKAMIEQFNRMASRHAPGRPVRFHFTHLHARYLADREPDVDVATALREASRFDALERALVQEIITNGTFHRTRAFVDATIVPVLATTTSMLDFSKKNASSGRVLVGKSRQMQRWRRDFCESGISRIEDFVEEACGELDACVPSFAEDHAERSDAGKRWNDIVSKARLPERAGELQAQLVGDADRALAEFTRELRSELGLNLLLSSADHIQMKGTTDWKRGVRWVTAAASGGLLIASIAFSPLAAVLAAASAGVAIVGGLFSFFFESRESKVRKQREKLQRQLHAHVDRQRRSLRKGLLAWFHDTLLDQGIESASEEFRGATDTVFKLADTQRALAWKLSGVMTRLNDAALEACLKHLGSPESRSAVLSVARVPGSAVALRVAAPASFPPSLRRPLAELLGEELTLVVSTRQKSALVAQTLGRPVVPGDVRVDRKLRVARVRGLRPHQPRMRTRVQLAQQLSRLQVLPDRRPRSPR